MKKSKILVLGASGSGKTTALKHLMGENIDIQSFDYGKAIIDGDTTYLFSSANSEGFIFFEDLLVRHIDGIIIFIDNQRGISETDEEIIDLIDKNNIPYIIFTNKQDLSNIILDINFDVLVVPTIAINGSGIKDGLKMLLKLIEHHHNDELDHERSMKDIVQNIKRLKNENMIEIPDINGLARKIKPSKNKEPHNICKIKLFLHPIELENVKKALINFGFSNLTIIEVGYVENNATRKESYRGKDYSLNIPKREEINLIIKNEDIEYVISALKTVKNEDIYDNIYISPVENVIRIRTKERGEEAVE